MPPDITWNVVQNDLNKLKNLDLPAPVAELVETGQKLIDAKPYDPEIVQGLVEIVRKMSDEIRHGKPLPEVFEQAKVADYVQPGWDVEKVINQNFNIYNHIVQKASEKIKEPEPAAIEVKVVLLVMTKTEATELVSRTAFRGLEAEFANDLQELEELLATERLMMWVNNYGETPQQWRPFANADTTDSIEELIVQAFTTISEREYSQLPLVPKFVDVRTINSNRKDLVKLRTDGCVVVNDVISMRHPLIQREMRRSLLDAFPNTVMVRVAPFASAFDILQPLVSWLETYQDLEFYKRLTTDWDPKCRQVYRSFELGSLFIEQVPKLIPNSQKAKLGITPHVIGRAS